MCVLGCNHSKILQGLFHKASCIRVKGFFFISSVAVFAVVVSRIFPIRFFTFLVRFFAASYPTVSAMAQPVPEHINFAKEEENILKLWKDLDAFHTSLKQSQGKPL